MREDGSFGDSIPDAREDVQANGHRQTIAWLRIYLGYAPGVGKTYAMLHDGRRLKQRGTDVVVGWVQASDRPQTMEAIGDLEVVPPRTIRYRDVLLSEMDVEAVIARRPQTALVDELAHTNVHGSKHLKRCQDVLELQAARINVISTLNIHHLANLQDTVKLLTGVTVAEVLADWVLDAADDIEMIDQSPEVVRNRLRRNRILPREQIDEELSGYFRLDALTALRELALQRIVQHTERRSQRDGNGHDALRQVRSANTVLVCVPASALAQLLVRRGVRLANRLRARLVVLHVTEPSRGVHAATSQGYQELVKSLQLARALGADVVTRTAGPNVAEALVTYAREVHATQLVLGETRRSRLRQLLSGSVVSDVLRLAADIDVHLVTHLEHRNAVLRLDTL